SFAINPANQHVFLQAGALPWDAAEIHPYHLLEFDKVGGLVRQTTAPPMVAAIGPTKLRRTAMMGAIFPLSGLPLLNPWALDEIFELDIEGHASLFYSLLFASALVSAAAALLISRRCGFSGKKSIAWTLLSGLIGPASVVVMLGLNSWPQRVKCVA